MSISSTARRLLSALAAAVFLTGTLVSQPSTTPAAQAVPVQDWLHAQGNKIVDEAGQEVWLTGTNWFGFNTSERVLHGLWSGNLQQITKSMADRGLNVVRIPISAQLLLEWSNGQTIVAERQHQRQSRPGRVEQPAGVRPFPRTL